jgi:acetyl esterase/lipase
VRRQRAVAVAVGTIVLVGVMLGSCGPPTWGGGGTTTTTTAAPNCATPAAKTTVRYLSIPGVPANATSLDVYATARPCDAPVVMWVHGGGYHTGDKRNQVADKVRLFRSRGELFVSINYRLTVAGDPTSAHYPDHFTDVANAVAWVHEHIDEFGGDPSKLALLGHSAGADIVSNVATNPEYLRDVGLQLTALTCAGPFDTEGFDKVRSNTGATGEKEMWLSALGNAPNYEVTTSAKTYVRRGAGIPPTIGVFRGTPLRQSIERGFLNQLAAAGVPATTIDARSLSHAEVNGRIGAPGDTVMTPPLTSFLDECWR